MPAITMVALRLAFALAPITQQADTPLFEGTGLHTRLVSRAELAQKYFDQGLNMLYAFHHGEAKRSFRTATKLDPNSPMVWWGLAMANGPHINNMAVEADEEREAYEALKRAHSLIKHAKPVDQDLIRAAMVRFQIPQPKDRGPLNRAFAREMRKVWAKYPKDGDVGALFAESMMDLRPWDLWQPNGTPQPGTLEIVRTLEQVLKIDRNNPMALHLYIHAVEASPTPEKAVAAADRLRDLQPGLGHNVHMPSHLDVRVGAWEKAVVANQKAMAVDANYRSGNMPAPVYRVYMAHNNHMLAFAAMMLGQGEVAIKAVDDLCAAIPVEFQEAAAGYVDGYFAMPYEVRIRFGKWDEVIAMPEPPARFPLARALAHGAQAVAHAAKGNVTNARASQAAFYKARREVPATLTFGNSMAHDILLVATHLMNGEILVAEGQHEKAILALKHGIAAEDKLRYSEPPDWIQPVRHTLGALLLKLKRMPEAESVFRTDLKKLPRNGWALYGLSASLKAQGKPYEAVEQQFREVWANSDVEITSSCLCIPHD